MSQEFDLVPEKNPLITIIKSNTYRLPYINPKYLALVFEVFLNGA